MWQPNDNSAREDDWYVEVSGERAGPLNWRTVQELVALGAVEPCDLIWSNHHALKSFADYAHLTGSQSTTAPPAAAPAASGRSRHTRLIGGATWTMAAITYISLSALSWPGITNGLLLDQLAAFGSLGLTATGAVLLPGLWSALKDRHDKRAGAVRILAALVAFCIFLILGTLLSNAPAIFFTAIGKDPMGKATVHVTNDGQLELKGPFSAGSAYQVAQLLGRTPAATRLHLNSPGGWVREGMLLADIVKSHHLATDSSTGCYSACVIAYLAGSPRTLDPEARLGFHSSSGLGTDSFYLNEANTQVADRLHDLGVSSEFIDKALSTPASELWTPDPSVLLHNHLIETVTRTGLADSGEALDRMAQRATDEEKQYAFIDTLKKSDPVEFSRFDRSLRLALRRSVEPALINPMFSTLESTMEARLLSRVPDEIAAQSARILYAAANTLSESDPSQCVAVLTNKIPDKYLSRPALNSIASVTKILLQTKATSPALSPLLRPSIADQGFQTELHALLLERPAEQCAALLHLYAAADTSEESLASLVRELKGTKTSTPE